MPSVLQSSTTMISLGIGTAWTRRTQLADPLLLVVDRDDDGQLEAVGDRIDAQLPAGRLAEQLLEEPHPLCGVAGEPARLAQRSSSSSTITSSRLNMDFLKQVAGSREQRRQMTSAKPRSTRRKYRQPANNRPTLTAPDTPRAYQLRAPPSIA